MIGVVLCGGGSTRMGSDKGLLVHNSIAWAELAANKLKAVALPIVVSVNEQQHLHYSTVLTNLPLVKDDDSLEIGGPLKGILSVHRQWTEEDLMVLACDMRDMQTDVLQHLIATKKSLKAEAFVLKKEQQVEPLCGVYTAAGLSKIVKQYEQGSLKKFSMHAVLQMLNTHYLTIPSEWEKSFANFNAPEDLHPL